MATNSLQSLHHHYTLLRRHSNSIDCPPSTLSSFLKPTSPTPTSLSSKITFSLSSSASAPASASASATTTPTTPSTSQTLSYEYNTLQQHLSSKNFRQADEETRRLLIVLAGEAAEKRGYVFFSEAQFISETELRTIDELWRQHSNNKFGYSVQKKIWKKVNKDFTKLFIKVGWMKKLESEVEQYNYRSFPTEFIWELTDDTPEGHLPLTNALRGTQLLNSILTHPAFEFESESASESEGMQEDEEKGSDNGGLGSLNSKPLSKRVFKSDYSF